MRDRGSPSGGWPRYGHLEGSQRYTSHPVGLVFPVRKWKLVVLLVMGAVCGVGVACLGLILTAGSASVVDVLSFGLIGLSGGGLAVAAVRGLVDPYGTALLPEGVYWRADSGSAWLPWESLKEVWVADRVGVSIGVRALELRLYAEILGPEEMAPRGPIRRVHEKDLTRKFTTAERDRAMLLRDAILYYLHDKDARERLNDPFEADRWARLLA